MFIEMIRLDEYYFSFDTRLYTEDTVIIYRTGKVEFFRYREDRTTETMEWRIGKDVISLLSRLAHGSKFTRFHKSYMPRPKELFPRYNPMEYKNDYYHAFHLGIQMEDGTEKTTIFSMKNSDTPARLVSLTEQIIELSEVRERVREACVR